jgi:hypothetical protein
LLHEKGFFVGMQFPADRQESALDIYNRLDEISKPLVRYLDEL